MSKTEYQLQQKKKKLKPNFSTSPWLSENGAIFTLTHFISFWQEAAKIISLHLIGSEFPEPNLLSSGGGKETNPESAEGGKTSTAAWYSGRGCMFILGKAFLS